MTTYPFNFSSTHPSWQDCIKRGLASMDPDYLAKLSQSSHWLPGPEKIFNAFSLPINKVNYVLFGESPYPRAESANGYAFWDNAVNELWSPTGLSKKVNRATSMRNILKMLLIAEDLLPKNKTSQPDIANIDKKKLVQTNEEFFNNLLQHGFLLLNATLVLQPHAAQKDARAWHPFMQQILTCLIEQRPQVQFILFGRIANGLEELINHTSVKKVYAEHPYNLSFITNKKVIDFFEPFHLLRQSR